MERICTDVAFLNDGEIIMQGKIADVKEKNKSQDMILEFDNSKDAKTVLDAFKECSTTNEVSLLFKGTDDRMFEMLKFVAEYKISVNKVERMERTLEALFLEVVNE